MEGSLFALAFIHSNPPVLTKKGGWQVHQRLSFRAGLSQQSAHVYVGGGSGNLRKVQKTRGPGRAGIRYDRKAEPAKENSLRGAARIRSVRCFLVPPPPFFILSQRFCWVPVWRNTHSLISSI